MKTYRFVCERHQEFGESGWRQESQPGFDPLGGMAVAHDIMEHFPNGDESPADEFQALGAGMILRGEDYYGNKGQITTSPAENAAGDMPEIIQHVVFENMHLPEPKAARKLAEVEEEDLIAVFLKNAYALVKSEFEHYGDDEDTIKAMNEVVRKSEGWIRLGMRRAKARYKGRRNEAMEIFCEIEKQADNLLKEAIEGQVMIVRIDKGGSTVRCEIEEPEYADY